MIKNFRLKMQIIRKNVIIIWEDNELKFGHKFVLLITFKYRKLNLAQNFSFSISFQLWINQFLIGISLFQNGINQFQFEINKFQNGINHFKIRANHN